MSSINEKQKWIVLSRRRWSEALPIISAIILAMGWTDQEGIDLLTKSVFWILNTAASLLALWTHLRPDGATLRAVPAALRTT